MLLMIPLGGLGTRFSKAGYLKPKALVNVFGKPIIFWLLDNLELSVVDEVLIPYNTSLVKYHFESLLRRRYPKLKFYFMELANQTRGAAETIFNLLEAYSANNLRDSPIICLDSDNF